MADKVIVFGEEFYDGAQITANDDGFYIQCFCEWCGDTETGFGAEVGHMITIEQAAELRDFLDAHIAAHYAGKADALQAQLDALMLKSVDK